MVDNPTTKSMKNENKYNWMINSASLESRSHLRSMSELNE